MAKVAIVLALLLISLVTLTVSATYYLSDNQSQTKNEKATSTPTPNPSSTPTPSPQPTAPLTPNPTIINGAPPFFPAIDNSTAVSPWIWTPTNSESMTAEIISPQNGSAYNQSNVNLQVNLGTHLGIVYMLIYKADWLAGNVTVFLHLQPYNDKLYLMSNALTISTTLHDVPAGDHNLTVYAMFIQIYDRSGADTDGNVVATINFSVNEPTIDQNPPETNQ
jgi:hypothetical protein